MNIAYVKKCPACETTITAYCEEGSVCTECQSPLCSDDKLQSFELALLNQLLDMEQILEDIRSNQ
jgi:hypothetical protein